MLEVRTGEAAAFRPLREINQLRKDKGLMALLRRPYEVFSLSVDIEFPKALYQWEKNSNYWDAAYKSLNPAVGPASTPSKCNRLSPSPAPSTTVDTFTTVAVDTSTIADTPFCPHERVEDEPRKGGEIKDENFFANFVTYEDRLREEGEKKD